MARSYTTTPAAYTDLGRSISVTSNDITVAAWVYLTSATAATRRIICQKNNGIANPHFAIGITTAEKAIFSRTPSATSATGFAATGATTVTTGAWRHIVGRQLGTEQSIWLDGVKDASNTIASGLTWAADAAESCYISRFSSTTEQNMVGAVAEVAVWGALGLRDPEIVALARGLSVFGLTNRLSSLTEYRALISSLTWPAKYTTRGSHTSGSDTNDHPRVFYPSAPFVSPFPPALAVDVTSVIESVRLGTLAPTIAAGKTQSVPVESIRITGPTPSIQVVGSSTDVNAPVASIRLSSRAPTVGGRMQAPPTASIRLSTPVPTPQASIAGLVKKYDTTGGDGVSTTRSVTDIPITDTVGSETASRGYRNAHS